MTKQQKSAATEEPLPAVRGKSLFERVAGYLDACDWHSQAFPDRSFFLLPMELENVTVRMIAVAHQSEDWQRLLVYSVLPVLVPAHRRPATLDAINRINHGLLYGSIEMDPADGEVRVRTVGEHGQFLDDDSIGLAIHANIVICETYFAGLMAVSFGNADPATLTEMVKCTGEGALQ